MENLIQERVVTIEIVMEKKDQNVLSAVKIKERMNIVEITH